MELTKLQKNLVLQLEVSAAAIEPLKNILARTEPLSKEEYETITQLVEKLNDAIEQMPTEEELEARIAEKEAEANTDYLRKLLGEAFAESCNNPDCPIHGERNRKIKDAEMN